MENWILYGKSGNPSFEVTKAWLKNHGIPAEVRSVFRITEQEIENLANISPRGVKGLAFPDAFSFSLINPQRASDQTLIDKIQSNALSDNEVKSLLVENPYLIVSPILTNFETLIIGYQYDVMVNKFRFFKVRDIQQA
ncbi:thioredoxin domain-containing protein [Peribacillus glennii]|uniref:Uncharacterized protein n=1 Tax=Peribacillus glennii TaxID=2303991 RepID=A0A372LG08_9BACI|nr:ArsC/Spx/MgsR family protein [Peribacillus glennii]RFU65009.1 hypothetical protein D0466_03600 [Peribacillus glennii]